MISLDFYSAKNKIYQSPLLSTVKINYICMHVPQIPRGAYVYRIAEINISEVEHSFFTDFACQKFLSSGKLDQRKSLSIKFFFSNKNFGKTVKNNIILSSKLLWTIILWYSLNS